MNNNDLEKYTKELVFYTEESYQRYFELMEDESINYDFFEVVKPYADKVKDVADEWKNIATIWIKEEKPKYLHLIQIETTYDHILSFTVSGFYRDTKQKRFKDTYQSILYVLNQIVEK
ncbi:YppE family protein [Litchfieldia salsa]|uniref:DUF1798 family protein n=1 Tax=Litchfieldia salsa TaxID=930152 RepID=A0A1H0TJE1_9BACI|nr:YppE family protein [Litchfieldia salsa]SDP54182.1 protein of unknown function [Litchfieldia salsa]